MCVICGKIHCPSDCINYEMSPIGRCEACGEDVYFGDGGYEIHQTVICENCIYKYKKTDW